MQAATDVAPTLPVDSFDLTNGRAEIFAHSDNIDIEIWRSAFADQHKDFDYYRLVEQTLTEHFVYRYLLVRDSDGRPLALQPFFIATQNLLATAGNFATANAARIRRLFPSFLRTRILFAGCVVCEGHLGLVESRGSANAIAEALEIFAKRERISLITFKDFPTGERASCRPLRGHGYTRLDGYPTMELPLNFSSFEEYIETHLSKATRKNLRRKLRYADAARPPITFEVLTEADDVIDEVYPLYLAVAQRSDVAFEIFTRDYFREAAPRMPGRFRYFVWRQAGRAIAFSFCTIWNDTIYDNDIGLDYRVAHQLHLYHVTFRDMIEWALQHGFRRYCSAPFNYEAKLRLRMRPMRVDIYVRHRSRIVNAFLKQIAPFFAPAKSDRALRPHYAN